MPDAAPVIAATLPVPVRTILDTHAPLQVMLQCDRRARKAAGRGSTIAEDVDAAMS
jgi:hypothetical protein